MNTVPEALPTLASGAHQPGDGKACVMEYVALLAGEKWTDSPSCTHPVLSSAAQQVNDRLSDADRHLLVPLIGRLFGTAPPDDELEAKRLSVGLAIWCAERVADLVRPKDQAVARAAVDAARRWVDEPTEANKKAATYAAVNATANAADANATYAAYAAAAAAAANATYATYAAAAATATATYAAYAAYAATYADARVAMLSGLIDEYDRLTGRTEHRAVSTTELASLRDRVAEMAR